MRAWIWMKFCMSTGVGTWTKWLTFEPDADCSPDAGTGLLSPISYVLQREILLHRENPTYRYWAPVAAVTRGFKMVLFTASRGKLVGGKCALASALLVWTLTLTLFSFVGLALITSFSSIEKYFVASNILCCCFVFCVRWPFSTHIADLC